MEAVGDYVCEFSLNLVLVVLRGPLEAREEFPASMEMLLARFSGA